jgi:hypothetical protein
LREEGGDSGWCCCWQKTSNTLVFKTGEWWCHHRETILENEHMHSFSRVVVVVATMLGPGR